MIVIPIPSGQPFWTQRVALDGAEYVLEGRWNQRAGKWFLGLLDADGNRLSGQVKVVCHFPLFRLCSAEGAPPGMLFARDTTAPDPTAEGRDPHLEDFGSRVLLVYVPEAEL